MGQRDLFKNMSIRKDRVQKYLRNNDTKNVHMNVQLTWFPYLRA